MEKNRNLILCIIVGIFILCTAAGLFDIQFELKFKNYLSFKILVYLVMISDLGNVID